LLPHFAGDSLSSTASPSSAEAGSLSPGDESEMVSTKALGLDERVVDTLVLKYLSTETIRHLIERLDSDPFLRTNYRMNTSVAQIPASLRLTSN
jgi:hypothetical protein